MGFRPLCLDPSFLPSFHFLVLSLFSPFLALVRADPSVAGVGTSIIRNRRGPSNYVRLYKVYKKAVIKYSYLHTVWVHFPRDRGDMDRKPRDTPQ